MASFRARFGAFKLYGEWKNKMLALSNPLLLELNVFFSTDNSPCAGRDHSLDVIISSSTWPWAQVLLTCGVVWP